MKKIVLLVIVFSFLLSCKERYCNKEIMELSGIKMPNNVKLVECSDNLEYQIIFEYEIKSDKEVQEFIEENKLSQYIYQNTKPSEDTQEYVIRELEEYFSPNKNYPRENTTYYVKNKNYTIVLDKSTRTFIGAIEY